jgi:Family of unknown function (DUF6444)
MFSYAWLTISFIAASCEEGMPACRATSASSCLERDRLVDQLDLAGLAAGQRLAGERVLLGFGQAEPVEPHARQVAAPDPRVRRTDLRVLGGDDQVVQQEERLARLEAQARQDLRTSSKPPSLDPPKTRQQRRAEARAKAK